MKRTDHAARNETHKSSPPRVDLARGEREGRNGWRRYRSPRGVSPFRNKNPSVEGIERAERKGEEREREKKAESSRGDRAKRSRAFGKTRDFN